MESQLGVGFSGVYVTVCTPILAISERVRNDTDIHVYKE